ncbi:MAG: RagB/SusD family nutrient uptake outer membrane protein [Bacteroidales bacterium]|nr:RagB/SusD family nutrient uptake outer membrane protein [Bacteroidales bacterium]
MRKTIISIAACACLASCTFLEVPLESTVSTSNYYNTLQEFDMSLTGVYNVLLSANWDDDARYGTYFQGFLLLGRVGTDEMVVRYDNGHGEKALGDYSYTPANVYVTRPWYMMYKGIQRANVIIDRLTPMTFEDTAGKERILAEAHFLRAFFYFHLVRLYGEVPLVTKETTDLAGLDMTKYPIADVYQQIVSDLQAAESLPELNAKGRPDRRAGKVMLAKVYLQMAGEPLKDSSAAAEAERLLADVIRTGGYELVTDYFSQFDGKHEYNSEYIWDIEFSNNGTTTYGGQVGTTEGVPSPESLYWTLLCTCPEFYNTFDAQDLRRDAIARYRLVYDDDFNIVPEYFKGEGNDYYYYVYKFRHALTAEERGSGWANWANPINFPVTRYADVLLMYAEAGLRAHGTVTAEQLECVNMVRRRGFGKPVDQPSAFDLSEITFGNLLAERSFELCFEGHRWYDLVRFGKLEEAVKKIGTDPVTAESQKQASNFQKKHHFYPVPQDVIDASHGAITQNELWK